MRRFPPVGGCCRAIEKLVSVGEEDQRVLWVSGGE
jgi:hypothetical protein